MSYNLEKQKVANHQALTTPRPGDYWHEMFCPYFIVVDVKGDSITVLSCLGGPDSFTRKDELNAKIDLGDGWMFDYSKSMVVDRLWVERAIRYENYDGFVADVINTEKTRSIVDEWRDHIQREMRKKIETLEREWAEFTGWRDLKEVA